MASGSRAGFAGLRRTVTSLSFTAVLLLAPTSIAAATGCVPAGTHAVSVHISGSPSVMAGLDGLSRASLTPDGRAYLKQQLTANGMNVTDADLRNATVVARQAVVAAQNGSSFVFRVNGETIVLSAETLASSGNELKVHVVADPSTALGGQAIAAASAATGQRVASHVRATQDVSFTDLNGQQAVVSLVGTLKSGTPTGSATTECESKDGKNDKGKDKGDKGQHDKGKGDKGKGGGADDGSSEDGSKVDDLNAGDPATPVGDDGDDASDGTADNANDTDASAVDGSGDDDGAGEDESLASTGIGAGTLFGLVGSTMALGVTLLYLARTRETTPAYVRHDR